MNKLVSRNSVQRFKQGRKIVKSDNGLKFSPRKEEHIGLYNRKIVGLDDKGKPIYRWGTTNNDGMFIPISEEKHLNDGTILNVNGSKSTERARQIAAQQKKIKNQSPDSVPPVVSGNTERPYYLKGFQSRMNQDLKNRSDVQAFQQKLIDLYGANAVGKYGADGTWGADTQAAYDRYLADQKRRQLADNLQFTKPDITTDIGTVPEPKVEPSVTPKLQSRYSNFDYSGSNRAIRDLGFNNYNGLVNFVKSNPNNPFAQDLITRFTDVNNWNQNDVESALGVSGTYKRGINGDFSDIMRSMNDWQLEARTDNNGTVYSSPHVKDLFEKVQVSPENRVLFPRFKFKKGGQLNFIRVVQ